MCGKYTENTGSDNTWNVNVRKYPHVTVAGAPADGQQGSTVAARFWAKVQRKTASECWPWLACKTGGRYGYIRINKVAYVAHRIAYELTFGAIPDGLLVRHKCDNPTCCNPNHLELGTQIDNMQDAIVRGRHAKGEGCGRHKLTESQALEILTAPSRSDAIALCVAFGVSAATGDDIRAGRSWAHLRKVA